MKTGIIAMDDLDNKDKAFIRYMALDGEVVYVNDLDPAIKSPFKDDSPICQSLTAVYRMTKTVDRLAIFAHSKLPALLIYYALRAFPKPHALAIIVDGHVYDKKQMIDYFKKNDLKDEFKQLVKEPPKPKELNVNSAEKRTAPNGTVLRPYQSQLVDFALEKKRVGLFVDMGLGKTLATLETISELVKSGKLDPAKPILVVAPIMVALDTWSREAEKWGYDFDVLINIRKTGKKREAIFEEMIKPHDKITLVATNPSQLGPMKDFLKERHIYHPFQMAVVDELSQFKSATTQRFKNLTALTNSCEYFIGLTGTPAPNNLLDIYSEMISIDPRFAFKLGANYYSYRSSFFEPAVVSSDGRVFKWDLKPGAENEIYRIISKRVVSLKSAGLIDLPKISITARYVTLPPKAMKTYRELDTKYRAEIAKAAKAGNNNNAVVAKTGEEQLVTIANSAVLTAKLLQLSSGAIYDDADDMSVMEDRSYVVYQDEKMKMLKDIVDSADSPVLVFIYFKSELDRLPKYVKNFEYLDPKDADKAKDLIKRWNKGEVPVMVAHPASAGHGLNLQEGGHIMIWLTTPWSNEQYRQSIKRLYRSGQTNPVSVIHIIAENTVDEEVLDKLDAKEENQSRLMDALAL